MKATKTTKVFDTTLDSLRILTKGSKEGLTQAQIISRAIMEYAVNNGYVYTVSGLVGIGDKVLVDGLELEIKLIVDNIIVFTDHTEIIRGSILAWTMQRVTND